MTNAARLSNEAYFVVDWQAGFWAGRACCFTRSFDARGNAIEGTCFGIYGELAIHKDGAARWTVRILRTRQSNRSGLFRRRWRTGLA